jgi:hypothetical protein
MEKLSPKERFAMNKTAHLYCILCLQSISLSVGSYELATHARLTNEAYKLSVINFDSKQLKDFGIHNIGNPFGESYYDMSGSLIRSRKKNEFEQSKNRMPEDVDPLSIQGWLMRGAIREDDYIDTKLPLCSIDAPNPDDDPYPDPPSRPLNHFYDPANDRALDISGLILLDDDIHKAPDWALGTTNAFAQTMQSDTARRNHFTLYDAIEAMYRATTGHDQWGQPAGRNDAGYPADATREDRNAYWATTFRSLGDMVHLVQDMGQPQHTRNDPHSGACLEAWFGHASVYERYIEARVTQSKADRKDAQILDSTIINYSELSYGGYPIPKFANYGDYWSTREGINGRGLADYSNRGFFSAGTNIGDNNNGYASPVNDASVYEAGIIDYQNNIGSPKIITSLLIGTVYDKHNPLLTRDAALSAESLWDIPTKAYAKRTYTLNRFNYDSMAALLIPRAVSYSAGLINHFFRGRLQILQAVRTGNVLTVRFKNVSATDINDQGIVFSDGKFELFYEDSNGIMQPLTVISSDLPSGSTTVATGETVKHDVVYTLTLTHPPEDSIAPTPYTDTSGNRQGTDAPFVLVYRGKIDQEAGIAAVTFARDGLTAYYAQVNSVAPNTPVTFTTRVAPTPGKGWRAFSNGPPKDIGLTSGPVTRLGNGELLVSGSTGADNNQYYAKLFKSSDSGRSYAAGISDLSPVHNGLPYSIYESKVFVGGASLVTLRKESQDTNDTATYRFYESDDLGQTWTAGGSFSDVVRRISRLVFLGEIGGQKHYAVLAVTRVKQGATISNRWTLLRSGDSGQTFVAEPIAQFVDAFTPPYTDASQASASLVHLGTDASGNATLGLAIKLQLIVDAPYRRSVMKYYTSNDSGVTWVERSEIPPSPRIVAGKFPEQSSFFVEDLIYLGTPEGGQPHLYLSVSQLNQLPGLDGDIIEYFYSADGGAGWTAVAGPDLTVSTASDDNGIEWEIMTGIPALFYPLDNGAVPGLYD